MANSSKRTLKSNSFHSKGLSNVLKDSGSHRTKYGICLLTKMSANGWYLKTTDYVLLTNYTPNPFSVA